MHCCGDLIRGTHFPPQETVSCGTLDVGPELGQDWSPRLTPEKSYRYHFARHRYDARDSMSPSSQICCEPKFPLWVSAPFVVVTIGVWIWFKRIWMPIIRFGRPFFRYRSFPFYLDTALEGTLEGLDRINGFDQITITLRCFIERYRIWLRSR